MFDIRLGQGGEVRMTGRLDAACSDAALEFLNGLVAPCEIDLAGLEYIASAGLRVLLLTQKRVRGSGGSLRLTNVRPQVYDIFHYAGFDQIFEMSRAP